MPNQTPIPHPTDRNLSLVPHVHGRGFRVVDKRDGRPARSGALKYVAAALLLLVGLGLVACGFYRLTRIEQRNAHVICSCP